MKTAELARAGTRECPRWWEHLAQRGSMSSAGEVKQQQLEFSSRACRFMTEWMPPRLRADRGRERRGRLLEISLVIALVAVGFSLRLWWALTIAPEQVSDARGYALVARELAAGNGYYDQGMPTAYYPVGYSAALAVFHTVFGPNLAVARIANAVLGLGTLLGVYAIARALTESRLAALVTLLAFAIYPADIAYTSITLSQAAFNTFALLGVALCLRAPKAASLLIGGALLGWATLTRNQGAALPVLLVIAWLLQRERPQRAKHALLVSAAFIATLAPWTIRNALAFDAFVPVSNNGGINLYIGNNPSARGRYKFSPKMDARLNASVVGPRRGGPNEVVVDRFAARLAWAWMSQQPRAALELWRPKFAYLYGDDEAPFGYWSRKVPEEQQALRLQRARQLNLRFYPLLLWLGGLGAGVAAWELCTRRKRLSTLLWLPAAVVVAFTALHMLTFGDPCYHHPMMPWIALYAGYGAASPWRYRASLMDRFPRLRQSLSFRRPVRSGASNFIAGRARVRADATTPALCQGARTRVLLHGLCRRVESCTPQSARLARR
jgi:4-amino-4-deoxy-L-arabinose transferase-like glycosyltransferase